MLGPTHLAPTITGRHDRHLGGYTASSSAWARYPTLGRLTDRQQPVDDKHSENSPVNTAAAVPACGISQNAHGSESKPVARIQISLSSNGQPVAARVEAGYLLKSLFASFDAAAGRLHVTTSAISQRINARESDEVLG